MLQSLFKRDSCIKTAQFGAKALMSSLPTRKHKSAQQGVGSDDNPPHPRSWPQPHPASPAWEELERRLWARPYCPTSLMVLWLNGSKPAARFHPGGVEAVDTVCNVGVYITPVSSVHILAILCFFLDLMWNSSGKLFQKYKILVHLWPELWLKWKKNTVLAETTRK